MSVWTLTYNGVTRDAAAWGVAKLARKERSGSAGVVTFETPGVAVDATPTFPQARNIVLTVTAVTLGSGGAATRFTVPNHLYFAGLGCRLSAPIAGSALPTGLAAGTIYYVVVIDANTLALAPTQADALAGANLIACGAAGTAPLTMRVQNLLVISKNGAPWFQGFVTKIPGKASGKSETQAYEVTDIWHYFEKTLFQQMWASFSASGGAMALVSTTQSLVTVGQSVSGVKMDLSQVFNEVMTYMTYALAGVPFPATMNATTLCAPALDDPYAVFQAGSLPPDLTVPYSQVRDKTCAEILKLLLRYLPDCVQWIDHTTTPATMNFGARSALPAKTISLFDGTVTSGFNPTRRDDLLVPLVICKYSETNTQDGVSTTTLTLDSYPPGVVDNTPGALIQTVDLQGGNATYQKQSLHVTDRPTTAAGSAALTWLQRKMPWLWEYNTPGSVSSGHKYDVGRVSIQSIATIIDPSDPIATGAVETPAGFTVNACTEELLPGGNVTPWMTENDGVFSAKLLMTVVLAYAGTDPATLVFFTNNPPATGTRVEYFSFVGTNGSTQTYQELTSAQEAEPIPTGLAQALFTTLSQLHFEGSLQLTEQEVTNPLPLGCVFNATDGNAEWRAMNALVLGVSMDVDAGVTTVQFGPTLMLGLQDLTELLRAQRGALFSYNLDQRTSGKAGTANPVIGHSHSADNHAITAPVAPPPSGPFTVLIRQSPSGSGYQAMVVLNSTLFAAPGSDANIALTGLNNWFSVAAGGTDTFWILGNIAGGAISGSPTIHSLGLGNGDYNASAAPWTTGGIVENDGGSPPSQTLFRKVIATCAPNSSGVPVVTQQVTTNLILYATAIGGYPALYPL